MSQKAKIYMYSESYLLLIVSFLQYVVLIITIFGIFQTFKNNNRIHTRTPNAKLHRCNCGYKRNRV